MTKTPERPYMLDWSEHDKMTDAMRWLAGNGKNTYWLSVRKVAETLSDVGPSPVSESYVKRILQKHRAELLAMGLCFNVGKSRPRYVYHVSTIHHVFGIDFQAIAAIRKSPTPHAASMVSNYEYTATLYLNIVRTRQYLEQLVKLYNSLPNFPDFDFCP